MSTTADDSSKADTTPLVLVTGVSGFIASWVAHAALKVGYRVRGTVRSLSNQEKVKHLKELCPGSRFELELVEADLTETDDAGWDTAVRGCDYILHVASPFPIEEPKDEDELIRPAVDGTLNVLKAAARMQSPPKRVVLTSSVAAVAYGTDPRNKIYSDDDWTVTDSNAFPIGAYPKSKTLAEKAAWNFIASLPAEKKFELSTVNPTLVLGPMLSTAKCSSADVIQQIAMGKLPGIPDLYLGCVSVLDVARAHILAMTAPAAAGKRFIVTNENISLRRMSQVICAELKQHKRYRPTTMSVPNWIVHTLAFFGDKVARTAAPTLSQQQQLEPRNARSLLGMALDDDPAELIKQMLHAAVFAGIIPDLSADQQITKQYVRPELDVSMIPKP